MKDSTRRRLARMLRQRSTIVGIVGMVFSLAAFLDIDLPTGSDQAIVGFVLAVVSGVAIWVDPIPSQIEEDVVEAINARPDVLVDFARADHCVSSVRSGGGVADQTKDQA